MRKLNNLLTIPSFINLRHRFTLFNSCFVFTIGLVEVSILMSGCSLNGSTSATGADQIKAFDLVESQLLSNYMNGSVEQARQSLMQDIQNLKTSNILDAHAQSGRLCIGYARLFALEKRRKNDADAESTLLLAEFWRARNVELSAATNDVVVLYVMSNTPQEIMKYVDTLDAGIKRAGPRYIQFTGK
jgi:hypothetical protein